MSTDDRQRMIKIIRRLGYYPKEERRRLWIYSTAAEQMKRNNPDVYRINSHRVIRPILESYQKMPDPYREQISLDLKRTFTDDREFVENVEYVEKMNNILISYAKRNSSVGYWQGMNYLAGMIVRVVEDEEEAFWTFWSLFESILPIDYFWLMTEILIDQKVFISLVQKHKK